MEFGHRKSDTRQMLVDRFNVLNNKWAPLKVVEHQSDAGKEFKQKKLKEEMAKLHITPRYSTPYCQYQNGWIEARMKEIDRCAKAMMFRGNAEPCDWPYAIRHAVRLHNAIPTLDTGRSPYEKSTAWVAEQGCCWQDSRQFVLQVLCQSMDKGQRRKGRKGVCLPRQRP